MVETRSGDLPRVEESFRAAMAELLEKFTAAEKAREHADRLRDRSMEELREDFISLNVQQNELMLKLQGDAASNSTSVPPGPNGWANYFATRQSKVGFLSFSGDDLNGWIFRCKHFFTVDQTPDEAKVKLAIIHLEGGVLRWHQNWARFCPNAMDTPWDEYVQVLEERFGDKLLGDPMSELLALKHTGTAADYHDQFEFLLGCVKISESYAVSFFINGLKLHIQKSMRMFMPKTLTHALSLTQLQEASSVGRDSIFSSPRKSYSARIPSQSSPLPDSMPLLPTPNSSVRNKRLLSVDEINDKRAKGLCYFCDEKYDRGHKCPRKQLFLIEFADEVESVQDVGIESVEDDNPLISIHASLQWGSALLPQLTLGWISNSTFSANQFG